MHFPALLADERLTQLQHSTAGSQYSGSSEATHNSPIQISCIVLIILGIVAKAAFAVESLDWLDYLEGLDIGMALMRAEGNMEYSYDHGCGLVLVLG
ncbi:hypothetical protein BCON_0150g00180 [Botryotinia convoluta]|uniref:Uncharacterized protein n=1 Tax=Botryotinia convoluta TaxID=54673 RepID=A0A4Z1HSE1_9HELO|nr:hypothetical protein BCON_0150g00180 [Botryotinia convoluta]